mgnify:CR=1 FL=1
MINLTDVYCTLGSYHALYEMLKERHPQENISHRTMPTFKEHCRFVDSRPYAHWYLVDEGDEYCGAVFILDRETFSQIGLRVPDHLRAETLALLMKKHPRKRFVANVAPGNASLKKFYRKQGFSLIQETYERK